MRNKTGVLLIGVIVGAVLAMPAYALAADRIEAVFAKFNLVINGAAPIVIQPITYDGTTYLPVRQTAQLLGYELEYLGTTRTIVLNREDGAKQASVPASNDTKETNLDSAPVQESNGVMHTTFEGMRAIKVGDEQFFHVQDFSSKWKAHFSQGKQIVTPEKESDYTVVLRNLAGLKEDHPGLIYMLDGEAYFNTRYYQDPSTIKMRVADARLKSLIDNL